MSGMMIGLIVVFGVAMTWMIAAGVRAFTHTLRTHDPSAPRSEAPSPDANWQGVPTGAWLFGMPTTFDPSPSHDHGAQCSLDHHHHHHHHGGHDVGGSFDSSSMGGFDGGGGGGGNDSSSSGG